MPFGTNRLSALFLVLSFFNGFSAPAISNTLDEANDLERELLDDASDGRLEKFSALEAGLIASGIPDRRNLARWTRHFETHAQKMLTSTDGMNSDYARARELFKRLHGTFLKQYDIHASDLISPLHTGRYNCVSATLLYNALLDMAEIPNQAVLVPSHTFAVVTTEKGDVEVETTSPRGFDPVRTEAEYKRLLKEYGFDASYSHGRKNDGRPWIREVTGQKRLISSLTLVAVVYSNLAAARIRDRDHRSATALLVKAGSVAEDPDYIKKTVVALVHNLTVAYIRSQEYSKAVSLVDETRRIPRLVLWMGDRLDYLEEQAWSHQVSHLLDKKSFKHALEAVQKGLKRLPASTYLLHNRVAVYTKWSISLMDQNDHRQACSVLLTGLREIPNEPMLQNNYHAAVQRYVKSLITAKRSDKALQVARFAWEQASKLYRSDQKRMLADLEFQLGWVHFQRKEYLEAATHFEAGVWTQDPQFRRNLGASLTNYANAAVENGTVLQAHTVLTSTLKKGAPVETISLWRAYWFVTYHAVNYALNENKDALALKLATTFPYSKLGVDDPKLARQVVERFVDLLSRELSPGACRAHIRRLADPYHETTWFARALDTCDLK